MSKNTMGNRRDREICESATPGPWSVGKPLPGDKENFGDRSFKRIEKEEAQKIRGPNDIPVVVSGMTLQTNMEFIAHFDPSKVAELRAENERLREERDAERRAKNEARRAACNWYAMWKLPGGFREEIALTAKERASFNGWNCFDGEGGEE